MKQLTQADIWPFRQIRLECLKNEPSAFGSRYDSEIKKTHEDWCRDLSNENQIFFGLTVNTKGLVCIAGLYKDNNNNGVIIGVYTNPEFRGNNFMKKLLNYVIEYFYTSKWGKYIFLKVLSTNKSAISLYKKLGFEIKESLQNQLMGDGNLHTQYLMQLNKQDKL